MINLSTLPTWDWARIRRLALVASAVALVVWGLAGMLSPAHFFRSYLVAYNFWLGIALGAMALLMIQHLSGGAWGLILRGIFEAATRTIPLLVLLAAPLALGIQRLYVWTQPDVVAANPSIAHKQIYLNEPAFLVRAGIYLGVWLLLAMLLNWWTRRQERSRQDLTRQARGISAVGLLLYGLTATFASIDWVMSLQPTWFSTIFPPLFAVGQALSGMAFSVIVLAAVSRQAPIAGVLEPSRMRDLGNLLLALVMIWAYLSFSQFLLIWAVNVPEEAVWYMYRIRGGWQWIALSLVVFQFALPFILLLLRDMKDLPTRLARVALLVLAMRFVDLFWWIEAAFPDGIAVSFLYDLLAAIGLGGIWLWWFIGALEKRPLLPLNDPYLPEYLPEVVHE